MMAYSFMKKILTIFIYNIYVNLFDQFTINFDFILSYCLKNIIHILNSIRAAKKAALHHRLLSLHF